MYTKIIHIYILYTKIVQIKIFYDNECTKKVHQICIYVQKMLKCLFFVHTNNEQAMQNLHN